MRLPIAILLVALAGELAAGTPRYALNVGEVIEYRRTVRTVNPASGSTSEVAEIEQSIEIAALGKKYQRWDIVAITKVGDAVTDVVQFTIDDRGELAFAEEFGRRPASVAPMREIFPTLPAALEPSATWLGQADALGRCERMRQSAATRDSLQIRHEQTDPTGVSEFLRQSGDGSIWFDLNARLVTRYERASTGVSGMRTEIRGELVGRETPAAGWHSRNPRELESLTQTLRMEDALIDEVTARPAKIELTLSRFERIWSEFLAQPPRDDASPFRQFALQHQRQFAKEIESHRARARLAEPWLGRAAAQWSFQDASGKTVTSESVRKGITVEVFWSCTSEPSLRMFSTPLALPRELPKTQVSVVFLNIDSDLSAARRAAEACGRGNRVVFAGLPMEGQAPADLPIVRILDEQGTIRRVLFGWRPSLADAIQAVVDGR